MSENDARRILTTHCGSLARPAYLLDLMRERYFEGRYDAGQYEAALRRAVAESVRLQAENGIDIVCDGEMGKTNFSGYVRDRLGGFEPRPDAPRRDTRRREAAGELDMFPEYYAEYAAARVNRSYAAPFPEPPMACTGPITYLPQAVQADIANLQAALGGLPHAGAFLPAATPRAFLPNEYYRSDEEYRQAYADALREEYRAIVEAGFSVQVDDPAFATAYGADPSQPASEREAEQFIETLNYALRGLPQERVRFHTCYSINMGPRLHDAPMSALAPLLLRIDAGSYSFEAANPRHAHEWRVWQDLKLPEGKKLIPGFVSHTTAMVEHPQWIADCIVSYARLAGRDNVIAGADCGFSSLAMYHPEIHEKIVWAKFRALAEGANLATRLLW